MEEAYVQTTSLGNGLSLKAGRFFSGVGYLNPQHAHTWDFVDNPLAYQAMLGTQYGDDGVQLTWLAPSDQYIELGAELGRGRGFPGSDAGRNGAGMTALTAHTGGDIGASHSWRAGLSVLNAKASDQGLVATNAVGSTVTNAFAPSFSGGARVAVGDLRAESDVLELDVTERDSFERFLDAVAEGFGRLDVLVNNAGIMTRGPFLDVPQKDYESMWAINVAGTFLCSQYALKPMVKARYGRIINLSSQLARMSVGTGGFAAYAATKGAVEAFTRAMAHEFGQHGVTVNAIAPGGIDTDMSKAVMTPEYRERSKEFQRSINSITDAARKKNLEAAALAYVDATPKCVNCHQYIRQKRPDK